jgi:hypothetical protein
VSANLGAAANSVAVSFVGPAASGGSPITAYSVVSSPAASRASGNASPIIVSCPSACTGYTFTVQARNQAGTGAPSAPAEVLTRFQVKATFFEPDTQPKTPFSPAASRSIPPPRQVTGLSWPLTESMTGPPMVTVPLSLPAVVRRRRSGRPAGEQLCAEHHQRVCGGGFAYRVGGLLLRLADRAKHPGAPGGVGNSFVTIYVNPADPTAPLTARRRSTSWCMATVTPGGMMGDTCMTGYRGRGTMGGYPVAQSISRK